MRACMLTSSLAVMVNGCLTQQISIQKILNQEDPLAPFLFLLMAKELSGLIAKVAEISILSRFRVGLSKLVVSHLQYAYDTLILEDPTLENLWSIKEILRGFEMASDL